MTTSSLVVPLFTPIVVIFVVSYLKSAGASTLKYALITHAHSDHSGGMSGVLSAIKVESIIMQEIDYDTQAWNYVCDKIDEKNIPLIEPQVGETYALGESTFTILAPGSDLYSDLNNTSICIRVVFGDVSMLFTGDAETISEDEMLRSGQILKSTILKIGHHGSSSSSSQSFLDTVDPEYAILSVGKDNEYGLPKQEILDRLKNVPIYRTDESGNILMTTDGKEIKFSTKPSAETQTESKTETQATTETISNTIPDNVLFVLNKSSKKYHQKTCSSIESIKSQNLAYIYSLEEIEKNNYSPCGNCRPDQ